MGCCYRKHLLVFVVVLQIVIPIFLLLSIQWQVGKTSRRTEITHASYDDVTSCPAASRYLDEAYGCRRSEFVKDVRCEGDMVEMHCPRAKVIAIKSAVFGFSNGLRDEASCTGHSQQPTAFDRNCQPRCVLQTAMHTCHGKRRCNFEANTETFGNRCPAGATKYFSVIYTCVARNVSKLLEQPDTDEDPEFVRSACAGFEQDVSVGQRVQMTSSTPSKTTTASTTVPTTTTTMTSSTTTRLRSSAMVTEAMTSSSFYVWNGRNEFDGFDEEEPHQVTSAVTSTLSSLYVQKYPPVRSVITQPSHPEFSSDDELKSPTGYPSDDTEPPYHGDDVHQSDVVHSGVTKHRSTPLWIYPLADWIWTWQFATENKEKFILYLSLGLCIGTITVLAAVIFNFIVQSHRNQDSCLDSTSRRSKPGRGAAQDVMSGSSFASPSWHDALGTGVGSSGGGAMSGGNKTSGTSRPTHFHESESSTGDDRTLDDPDDVDVTSFNHHVDSLPRRCSAAAQQFQQTSNGATTSAAASAVPAGLMMPPSTSVGASATNTAAKCPHHLQSQQQSQQQQLQQQQLQQQQQQLQQQAQLPAASGLGASSVVRPGSSLGAPVVTTTATINRSYNPVHASVTAGTRNLTPALPPSTSSTTSAPPPPAPGPMCNGTMTLGHAPNGYGSRYAGYQIGGGNPGMTATTTGGGGGPGGQAVSTAMATRGPMIGSLGRSFSTSAASNQYGIDIGAYHHHHHPQQHQQQHQQHPAALYHNSHAHQYEHGVAPQGHNHQDIATRTLGSMQHYYG